MKTSRIIAIIVAVAAILWILSGIVAPNDTPTENPETSAQTETKEHSLFQVRITPSTAQDYTQNVRVTGRTQAARRVEVRAETAGQINSIEAKEGQTVKKNALLAVIEPRERGALSEEARQRVTQARIEFDAAQTLYDRGFASKARLATARANLDGALASQKATNVDLSKTRVTAPFDGFISTQNIEPGDFSNVGDALFTLVNLNPIEVVAFISEQDIHGLTRGQDANVHLFNGAELSGTLTYVAPAADERTRTFRILVEMNNDDEKLKEGVTADLILPAQEIKAHQISPAILSLNEAGKVGIKAVNMNGIVEFHPVNVLSDTSDYMWVGGLPDQLDIITVGQNFVMAGQKVEAVSTP